MALITLIQRTARRIRCRRRTVLEVNYDERLFSLWTAAAGAETGTELSAASIQLDRAQARRLRALLDEFLSQAEPDT